VTSKGEALFVTSSATRRGAEVEALELARALRELDERPVDIAALAPSDGETSLDVDVLGSASLTASTLLALRRRASGVGVVVAFGSRTLPACALALLGSGVPFVYRSIGNPGDWVRGRVHRARTATLMRRATRVVALWQGAADALRGLYGLDAEDIAVIPNARDACRFVPPTPAQRARARRDLGIEDRTPLVASIGALVPEKAVELAIGAVGRLQSVRLVVAGSGSGRASLEGLAAGIPGSRISFVGPVDDVVPILHAADAVVIASQTEGIPGVAIEALLCGVPVVATDVGGLREVIADGRNGCIVPSGDVDAITTALQAVVQTEFPRGDALHHAAEARFSLATVAQQWAALLDEVAA
jgi:glycosyltransferase involved in cell wall biosynthesis